MRTELERMCCTAWQRIWQLDDLRWIWHSMIATAQIWRVIGDDAGIGDGYPGSKICYPVASLEANSVFIDMVRCEIDSSNIEHTGKEMDENIVWQYTPALGEDCIKKYMHRSQWFQITKFWWPYPAQVPQCIGQIFHNALFCNRNVYTCTHFCCNPADTSCNNDIVITLKWRHFDVIKSKWRRFDVISRYHYVMCSVGIGKL